MRRIVLIVALLAFLVPAAATAGNPPPPTPYVLDGGGGGGTSPTGCNTKSVSNGDGYGNTARAYASWCWSYGKVTSFYGGSGVSLCGGQCSFAYWEYQIPFQWGMSVKAWFDDVGVNIYGIKWSKRTSARACINVDGWGRYWEC